MIVSKVVEITYIYVSYLNYTSGLLFFLLLPTLLVQFPTLKYLPEIILASVLRNGPPDIASVALDIFHHVEYLPSHNNLLLLSFLPLSLLYNFLAFLYHFLLQILPFKLTFFLLQLLCFLLEELKRGRLLDIFLCL